MNTVQQNRINTTLKELFNDSRNDKFRMMKGAAKGMFRPIKPKDFEEVYLSISNKQGEHLKQMIQEKEIKNVIEFGTSFGISTLFLAQGVMETGGHIITTELLASKAKKAIQNFKDAGVDHLIELRVGDATETLKNHSEPVDLLLLDGWKDLYLQIFRMLETNFHNDSCVYVDNANFPECQAFLRTISSDNKYHFESLFGGSVVLITLR